MGIDGPSFVVIDGAQRIDSEELAQLIVLARVHRVDAYTRCVVGAESELWLSGSARPRG